MDVPVGDGRPRWCCRRRSGSMRSPSVCPERSHITQLRAHDDSPRPEPIGHPRTTRTRWWTRRSPENGRLYLGHRSSCPSWQERGNPIHSWVRGGRHEVVQIAGPGQVPPRSRTGGRRSPAVHQIRLASRTRRGRSGNTFRCSRHRPSRPNSRRRTRRLWPGGTESGCEPHRCDGEVEPSVRHPSWSPSAG